MDEKSEKIQSAKDNVVIQHKHSKLDQINRFPMNN